MANASRRCLCCKEYGPAIDGVRTPRGWFIDATHALTYAKASQDRTRKREQKAERKVHVEKVRNFRMKDITHQHKLTQTLVNKLCNLLDKGKPCISCGRPDGGPTKRNASHFKSRGANSYLRYSLLGLHSSCVVCNLHLSGNVEGYRKGLDERYGEWLPVYLDQAPRTAKWTPEALKAIRTEVAEEIRRIESGLPPSRDYRAKPSQDQGSIAACDDYSVIGRTRQHGDYKQVHAPPRRHARIDRGSAGAE